MTDQMGDINLAVAMADHFDKIQKLPDPVAGCPNFRRVPGYKVYCCGQPTVAGFQAALNKVRVAVRREGVVGRKEETVGRREETWMMMEEMEGRQEEMTVM